MSNRYQRTTDGRRAKHRRAAKAAEVVEASYWCSREEPLNADFNPPLVGQWVRVILTGEIGRLTQQLINYEKRTAYYCLDYDMSKSYSHVEIEVVDVMDIPITKRPTSVFSRTGTCPVQNGHNRTKPAKSRDKRQRTARSAKVRKHEDMERVGEPIPLHMRADLKRPPIRLQPLPDVLQQMLDAVPNLKEAA